MEKIKPRELVIKDASGSLMVEGEAKNKDTNLHSFTLTVGLYNKDGKLVDVASGALHDLAGGDTKTFTAITTGSAQDVKSYEVFVGTMVQ